MIDYLICLLGRTLMRYEAVPGYFLHDDPANWPVIAISPRFGLNDDSNDRWKNFLEGIKRLNEQASGSNTVYKFFLLIRHGQGYHNVALEKYGTEAWDTYWSLLNGDGDLVWGPDPELTEIGIQQAQTAHENYVLETKFGLPAPQVRFCSPLTRALQTTSIIFDGTFDKYPSGVIVKENCREQNGIHTCDKRKSVSYIASRFPGFEIDKTITEDDQLWSETVRETDADVAARAKIILDDIFGNYDVSDIFVSITAHNGFINGFLIAIGGITEFDSIPTGGVLPVVVKAQID